MKKVSSVNIGGLVFQIDSEAYGKLDSYIAALENQFSSTEGSDEIIGDIEYRIAEIFQEKIKQGQESIRIQDINDVIQIMGAPKDLDQEDELSEAQANANTDEIIQESKAPEAVAAEEAGSGQEKSKGGDKSHKKKYAGQKRFFRDTENQMLGGVCSGFAAYIDMDPLIIRLAFVIGFLAFGISPVVYLVLWVLIPEAKTSSDKLQMRGEKVTIESIEKTIKKEAKELKKRFENFSGNAEDIVDKTVDKTEKKVDDFFVETGSFFRRMFRGGARIIIGLLISVILISIVAAVATFAGGTGYFHHIVPGFSGYIFSSGMQSMMATLGLIAVVAIPVIILFYKVLKLMLGIKVNTKAVDGLFLICWIVGLGVVIAVTARVATEFQREISYTEINTLSVESEPVNLYLNSYEPRDYYIMKTDGIEVYEDEVIFQNVQLNISQSHDDQYLFEAVRKSKGKNKSQATRNAKAIQFDIDQTSNGLGIADYYRLTGSTWRDQELDLNFRVPVGKSIVIDSRLSSILHNVETAGTMGSSLYNNTLVMGNDGLTLR